MNWYQLLLDDINALERQREELVRKAGRYFGLDFAVYHPLPFTDHTGLTETVEEEIEFVIACQQAEHGAHSGVEDFVKEWGFSENRKKRVVALSGGWRKFLGLALFTNRKTAAKFYLDAVSHLADQRLALLFERLESNSEQAVLFCEYDSLLLPRLRQGGHLLYDAGEQLEPIEAMDRPPAPRRRGAQTNYEQP